jgi:hypothetical protein
MQSQLDLAYQALSHLGGFLVSLIGFRMAVRLAARSCQHWAVPECGTGKEKARMRRNFLSIRGHSSPVFNRAISEAAVLVKLHVRNVKR